MTAAMTHDPDIFLHFHEAVASAWHVSPSTLYKVDRWSESGLSAWMEMGGETKCVPLAALVTHRRPWQERERRENLPLVRTGE
jgi:hypothetical protein